MDFIDDRVQESTGGAGGRLLQSGLRPTVYGLRPVRNIRTVLVLAECAANFRKKI
jgi:hypothetical protein